jgi:hypothetical protein
VQWSKRFALWPRRARGIPSTTPSHLLPGVVWVATATELVSIEVQYESLGYDLADESQRLKPEEPTHIKAWARALRTVERVDYQISQVVVGAMPVVAVQCLDVTFADGQTLQLARDAAREMDNWLSFVEAIRSGMSP